MCGDLRFVRVCFLSNEGRSAVVVRFYRPYLRRFFRYGVLPNFEDRVVLYFLCVNVDVCLIGGGRNELSAYPRVDGHFVGREGLFLGVQVEGVRRVGR